VKIEAVHATAAKLAKNIRRVRLILVLVDIALQLDVARINKVEPGTY
jgi:hypothetical protein